MPMFTDPVILNLPAGHVDLGGDAGRNLRLQGSNALAFIDLSSSLSDPYHTRLQSDAGKNFYVVVGGPGAGAIAAITVKPTGEVGIGTTPQAKLHVQDSTLNNVLLIKSTATGATAGAFGAWHNNMDSELQIGINASNHSIPNAGVFWNYANGPIRIATNGSEAIRITAAGNVGIGMDNPGVGARLEVAGGAVRVGGREVINATGQALYA